MRKTQILTSSRLISSNCPPEKRLTTVPASKSSKTGKFIFLPGRGSRQIMQCSPRNGHGRRYIRRSRPSASRSWLRKADTQWSSPEQSPEVHGKQHIPHNHIPTQYHSIKSPHKTKHTNQEPVLSLSISPTRDHYLTSSADAIIAKHPLPSQETTPQSRDNPPEAAKHQALRPTRPAQQKRRQDLRHRRLGRTSARLFRQEHEGNSGFEMAQTGMLLVRRLPASTTTNPSARLLI